MSQYLKGETKETVLELIKNYLGFRLTNEEILDRLKESGHEISERTLRRYKSEIQQMSGGNMFQVFQNEVLENIIEDIFTMRELQRIAWQEYQNASGQNEKFKALALVRNSTADKIKILSYVPHKYRMGKFRSSEEIKKTSGGADSQN